MLVSDLWPYQAIGKRNQETRVHHWDYGRLLWLPGQCRGPGSWSWCCLHLWGAVWHQRPAGSTSPLCNIQYVAWFLQSESKPNTLCLTSFIRGYSGFWDSLYSTIPFNDQHYLHSVFIPTGQCWTLDRENENQHPKRTGPQVGKPAAQVASVQCWSFDRHGCKLQPDCCSGRDFSLFLCVSV